jgi:predicted enzyme related to lactoylglutathione lyase
VADEFTAGLVIYAADVRRLSAFYQAVAELAYSDGDDTHARLTRGGFDLVLLATDQSRARPISVVVRRSEAAIKPVFYVADLAAARQAAGRLGGSVGSAKDWRFHGHALCDGVDPEGNVFQLRSAT